MSEIVIRNSGPEDYAAVTAVMKEWWNGRDLSGMLHELFFIHFKETAFVAEEDGQLAGFLNGFFSQTYPEEAYIHFVGVRPDCRKSGLGRRLYEHFFKVCLKNKRRVVRCCTAEVNKGSIEFHLRMGFEIEKSGAKVLFKKEL